MSNTNITTTTETTTVVVEENIVRIELNNIGVQGVPGANNDPVYVTVTNKTGALLTKGSIVYVSGGNGVHTQVTKALATSDATSARVLGWLSQDIANNADGLCMVEGYLDGVDTQGVTEGAQLYLSGTTAGAYQVTKPVAPIHLVYVGVAVKASAGNGRVYVKVQNGYELGELHDVLIVSPTNNQVLAYDSATQLWKNAVNAPDGVTSITAVSPLTGGTITSTGSIGLNQSLLSITRSQVSDFTSGTVTSAGTAQQAGTALFATNASTAVFATTSGTATFATNASTAVNLSGNITRSQVSDFTSGTVAQADNATTSGTALFANTSGTATYSTTSGTALTISGDITKSQVSDFTSGTVTTISGSITKSQVSDFTSGTVTSASTAQQAGTAVFATNASTAVTISGSITPSQVTGTAVITTDSRLTDSRTPTGSAGGDLTGTYPNPTIAAGVIVDADVNASAAIAQSKILSLVSDLAGKANLAGGNAFTGAQTITGTVAGSTQLIVRNASGQTANTFQARDAANNPSAWITASGQFVSSQSDGFSIIGAATFGSLNAGQTVRLQAGAGVGANAQAVVRGVAGATGHLLQLQDSSGTVLSGVSASGRIYTGTAPLTNSGAQAANISALADGATITPLVVRGAASQSANLQEWQNNAGGLVATMSAAGDLALYGNGITSGDHRIGTASYLSATLNVQARSATERGTVIRGAASQTANLQEWQNSAGTVLARVSSSGQIVSTTAMVASGDVVSTGGSVKAFNGLVTLGGASAGGFTQMTRSTSAQANPGANIGTLYFRDGTNAGTLRLVVRAGAAGAETTILDNIPQ